MTVNDWVILITALGGIEGIKQFLKWWMSRRTNARIEDAHADVEEFKALREYNGANTTNFCRSSLVKRKKGLSSRPAGCVPFRTSCSRRKKTFLS